MTIANFTAVFAKIKVTKYSAIKFGIKQLGKLRNISFCLIIGGLTLLTACDTDSHQDYHIKYLDKSGRMTQEPIYTFAVHPLHNPTKLFSIYQPLVNIVNKNVTGFSLRLVASRDYAAFEQKLYAGRFHFALPNPLQTFASLQRGYTVFAKMGDDDMFRGIIIMRRDAKPLSVQDLKGGALSFPAPTALAATMLPKYFLKSNGLNLSENTLHYVGSQESAIMNVFMGKTLAAGTWPLPWELLIKSRPELAEVLEVKWLTEPLINNGLVALSTIPREHVKQVLDVLLELHNYAEGKKILGGIHVSCFETASDVTYLPVQKFLENYRRLFPDEILPVGVSF